MSFEERSAGAFTDIIFSIDITETLDDRADALAGHPCVNADEELADISTVENEVAFVVSAIDFIRLYDEVLDLSMVILRSAFLQDKISRAICHAEDLFVDMFRVRRDRTERDVDSARSSTLIQRT